ncbi:MAG TPA: choice-of-anchor tandem repeat GloVer-containing protein [Terriglobales bacterium]|jgi:uncharacterized repeat protein (TIGR03803 family)|nr:choice-of-anchor tandem repeat GloVer-containing protein [Terriglobales bacterium]
MKRIGIGVFGLAALLAFSTIVVVTTAQAQIFSVLYSFDGSTSDPLSFPNPGILTQGQDGNIYATSVNGGEIVVGEGANGTVFNMTPAGVLSELYSFEVTPPNIAVGCNPYSGVTLGTDGNFYGTTIGCGDFGFGAVFVITASGDLTPLYSFTGGSDGGNPRSAPVEGRDGNFYGVTEQGGGPDNCGTVYQITPSGTLTTLHVFDTTSGCGPFAPLVQGTDGNFYGTAQQGSNLKGVVFKITPSGTFNVLYNFDGPHGQFPLGSLTQGSDGKLYGTTEAGGTFNGGVVFRMTTAGKITVLHSFNPTPDGFGPVAGLVQATDGNFYGVTGQGGGPSNSGTIFSISPKTPFPFSVLQTFDGTTAGQPEISLLQHTNGLLYGLSLGGGTHNFGTFYSLNVALNPFVSLVSTSGPVGSTIGILGQGFTGTKKVVFAGGAAAFTVVSDTYLTATVPALAKLGFVTVKTPSGALKSNKKFRVTP